MDLRRVRYFVAVAEALHFTRAAEKLEIAQASLSQQIRALEADLGVMLLERDRRRVLLTSAGIAFLDEAKELLVAADRAVAAAREAAGIRPQGVTAAMAWGIHLISDIVESVQRAHPLTPVTILETTSTDVQEGLRDGRFDFGIFRGPQRVEELVSRSVGKERLVLWLPADHEAAGMDPIDLSTFRHDDFLIVPRSVSPGLHDLVVDTCRRAGFEPRLREVPPGRTPYLTIALLKAGRGVHIAIDLEDFDVDRHGVVKRSLPPPAPRTEILLAWHRERARSLAPTLTSFADCHQQSL